MKKILIKLSNGETWELDAHIVSHERATYYSESGNHSAELTKLEAYDDEYQYAINHADELTDWLGNQMDWDDIKNHVRLVVKEVDNRAHLFGSAEFEV